MADQRNGGISWTDVTWSVTRGCSLVSPGCKNCYAMRQGNRFKGDGGTYEGLVQLTSHGPLWTGEVIEVEKHLLDPLHWRRPRRVFPNSMSDLFHEKIRDVFLDRVFAVMSQCPQHHFQLLTKRTKRLVDYLTDPDRVDAIDEAAGTFGWCHANVQYRWPLPNVWIGFSAENQHWFDQRWCDVAPLAQAGWRLWCSAEPLLGPIDIRNAICCLDWLVTGGESGPRARPPHPDWFRRLRDTCTSAEVPFHLKQWGEFQHGSGFRDDALVVLNDGRWARYADDFDSDTRNNWSSFRAEMMAPVGKKAAGATLDGREWREFPRAMEAPNG